MNTATRIDAVLVREADRLAMLPRHFGGYATRLEDRVYDFMGEFAREYRGGYWEFVELSNGGCYLRPPAATYAIRIDCNGFEGSLSADAAGITVCLFALSHLSFEHPEGAFARHFYALRAFALEHAEASAIFAAID